MRGCFVAFLWLLFLRAKLGQASVVPEATPEEVAIVEYAKNNGAHFDFTIGRACQTCVRGAIATKDIETGAMLLSVPISLGIPLRKFPYTAFPGEYAYHLAIDMYNDPHFNATHGTYWASMPGDDEVLAPELLTDAQLASLQTPELAKLLRTQREVAKNVYYGNLSWNEDPPLRDVLGSATPSLSEFLRIAALIGTRDFGFSAVPGQEGDSSEAGTAGSRSSSYLIPIADMVNHRIDANAERHDNGTHLLMFALRSIHVGEGVTNNYQIHVIHRPDMAFYVYGFVDTKVEEDGSLLCAVDLPTYSPENAFGPTKDTDSSFYGPEGMFNTRPELARLRAMLEEMETTEEEDVALLENGGLTSWQDEVVVKFRLARKRALRRAVEAVKAQLQLEERALGQDTGSHRKEEL